MSITSLLAISLGAILTNNFIFAQFLGICPFLGVSKKSDTAIGMGLAVTFVMGIASAVCFGVNKLLIALDLGYMQTVAFILVIAGLVQFIEMFLKKSMPSLYTALGVYLPLITTNCAVLGVVLLNVQNDYTFIASVVYGITGGLGFLLAIYLFSTIRERVQFADYPKCFEGFPIALITAGLIALAFVLGAIAIVFGLILSVAAKVFEVKVDERLPKIQECLAGANCGGCGYPGCAGCAEAILAGKAPVTACAPAGAEGAAKIAAIMGMEAPSGEKMVAHVICNGGRAQGRRRPDRLLLRLSGLRLLRCRLPVRRSAHQRQGRCRGRQGKVHQLRRLPRGLPAQADRRGPLQAEGVRQLREQEQGARRHQGLRQLLHRLRYVRAHLQVRRHPCCEQRGRDRLHQVPQLHHVRQGLPEERHRTHSYSRGEGEVQGRAEGHGREEGRCRQGCCRGCRRREGRGGSEGRIRHPIAKKKRKTGNGFPLLLLSNLSSQTVYTPPY